MLFIFQGDSFRIISEFTDIDNLALFSPVLSVI